MGVKPDFQSRRSPKGRLKESRFADLSHYFEGFFSTDFQFQFSAVPSCAGCLRWFCGFTVDHKLHTRLHRRAWWRVWPWDLEIVQFSTPKARFQIHFIDVILYYCTWHCIYTSGHLHLLESCWKFLVRFWQQFDAGHQGCMANSAWLGLQKKEAMEGLYRTWIPQHGR